MHTRTYAESLKNNFNLLLELISFTFLHLIAFANGPSIEQHESVSLDVSFFKLLYIDELKMIVLRKYKIIINTGGTTELRLNRKPCNGLQ